MEITVSNTKPHPYNSVIQWLLYRSKTLIWRPLMSKYNLVAFRIPAELHGAFNQAVADSGGDKTAWLLDALRGKLNEPESNPQLRMLELVEQMEVAAAALAGGKQGIPPTLYNEAAVIGICC